MWIIIHWKEQERVISLGYAADFCPVCRQIRTFEISEIRMATHLWFIPVERGTFLRHQQACVHCRVMQNSHRGRFARFERSPRKPLEDLIAETNPNLRASKAERLAVEEKIAAGGEGIDAGTRTQLLLEPFAIAEPHFDSGFGQEGRRMLALALRPLQPTEDEIRACLTRYRSGFNRMGKMLRTADVMNSIYPERQQRAPGSFDY